MADFSIEQDGLVLQQKTMVALEPVLPDECWS